MAHPEISHHVIDPAGPECSCGYRDVGNRWRPALHGSMVQGTRERGISIQGDYAERICEMGRPTGDALARARYSAKRITWLGLAN